MDDWLIGENRGPLAMSDDDCGVAPLRGGGRRERDAEPLRANQESREAL